MLLAKIRMQAGGGWEGHVFFRVEHPVTHEGLSDNSWDNVVDFCKKRNLEIDSEILAIRNEKLDYSPKYGWLVPKDRLDHNIIVTSAMNYLKEIQKDIF